MADRVIFLQCKERLALIIACDSVLYGLFSKSTPIFCALDKNTQLKSPFVCVWT